MRKKTTIILYIIAAVLFFTGIIGLLRQLFSARSPPTMDDIVISILNTILTIIGTSIGIVTFFGDKQVLMVNNQNTMINNQNTIINNQNTMIKMLKQLGEEHKEMIKLLQEMVKLLVK